MPILKYLQVSQHLGLYLQPQSYSSKCSDPHCIALHRPFLFEGGSDSLNDLACAGAYIRDFFELVYQTLH